MPERTLSQPGGMWEGGNFTPTQCGLCRQRFYGEPRCNAFPEGIALRVPAGLDDHHQPHPGDHGIRFTPMPPSTTEGPVQWVYINHHDDAGNVRTCGALWVSATNDGLGYLPAPGWENRPETATWLRYTYRGGQAIHLTAVAMFERLQELCTGWTWSCSEEEQAPDRLAVDGKLLGVAVPPE